MSTICIATIEKFLKLILRKITNFSLIFSKRIHFLKLYALTLIFTFIYTYVLKFLKIERYYSASFLLENENNLFVYIFNIVCMRVCV